MKNSYFSFPSERRQQRVQNLPCGLIPFIIVYVLYCGYRLVVGHDLAMVETGVRFPLSAQIERSESCADRGASFAKQKEQESKPD